MKIDLRKAINTSVSTLEQLTNFVDDSFGKFSSNTINFNLNGYCDLFIKVLNFFWDDYISRLEAIERSEAEKIMVKLKNILDLNRKILEKSTNEGINIQQIQELTKKRNDLMAKHIKLLQQEDNNEK